MDTPGSLAETAAVGATAVDADLAARHGTNAQGARPVMRAAVLTVAGRIDVAEVSRPDPRPDEVRVRLEGCGVCGSNLPPWEGRPWFQYPFSPGAPGHEGWGRVDAVGSRVTAIRPGDRVAMLGCEAFAEWAVVPEVCVVRLPRELDGKPFPGEALGCAMNVFRRAGIREGHTVAIVGIGFLGAVLAALCARMGASVIAISRRPFALETALSLGAKEALPLNGETEGKVIRLTAGQGCDRVIEAVGAQQPLDLAGRLVRERGRLIIAGYHQDGLRQVNLQMWNWKGLDVINAHERDPRVCREGIEAAVQAVAAGVLDASPLFTHCFELDEINRAFQVMQERPGNFMKALITMDS